MKETVILEKPKREKSVNELEQEVTVLDKFWDAGVTDWQFDHLDIEVWKMGVADGTSNGVEEETELKSDDAVKDPCHFVTLTT